MNIKTHLNKFTSLVYKNYRGQVAIFVALIFQIVFILFALMINVGLLVHHKINLQQSTDLAAYYGAMKQAEMLNVISHVNFQIRQSFKLLTWRYRVLGTFGLRPFERPSEMGRPAGAVPIDFPLLQNPLRYNPASESSSCSIANPPLSPFELPFMCLGHFGFKEYPSPGTETFCKADCDTLKNTPLTIPSLDHSVSSAGAGAFAGIINNYSSAILRADLQIKEACIKSGPTTIIQLAKYYLAYLQDSRNKKKFIKMLMANLSASEAEMFDIEGNNVLTGVESTFKNNLTEANNSSLSTDGTILTFNSIAETHSDCGYAQVTTSNTQSGSANLFAEINFKFINYFITRCSLNAAAGKDYAAGSIYSPDGADLLPELKDQIKLAYNAGLADTIAQIMTDHILQHTVGIEKNPRCSIYYGVKATTKPIIPFLPIDKISLSAISLAKPFGGSVGPRQYKEWKEGNNHSSPTTTQSYLSQTDQNLPMQDPTGITSPQLADIKQTLLNYSNYVGDPMGLADPKYLAFYYDMLLSRKVGNGVDSPNSRSKQNEPNEGTVNTTPQVWPAYSEWNNLTNTICNGENYNEDFDPLAQGEGNKNSFMRDIELSVVAPNQFETTYYSIEPDFYNTYVKNKLEKGFSKLKSQAQVSDICIPRDFGDNRKVLSNMGKPADFHFSVLNQLEIVQHVIKNASKSRTPSKSNWVPDGTPHATGLSTISGFYFTFIPFLPGSLLTSWTMKDYISDDYSEITQSDTTTPFAQCLDVDYDADVHGETGYDSIAGQDDPKGGTEKLPAAPGNCISGGRTGYSVKIVSPSALITDVELISGSGNTETIKNPPRDFLIFN